MWRPPPPGGAAGRGIIAPVNGSTGAAPAPSGPNGDGCPLRASGPVASLAWPPGTPRRSESTRRDRSSAGTRKVPVQVPPCQMLITATPEVPCHVRRRLRELPRTSKKVSPSRDTGPASDADMLMRSPHDTFVHSLTDYCACAERVGYSAPLVKLRPLTGVSPRSQDPLENSGVRR